MNKNTKLAVGIGALLTIIVVIAVAASRNNNDAVQVKIEAVGTRDLISSVSASGWIRPHRKVDVQADIMGRITSLAIKEGQQVTKGQILLRIDPTQYEAAV